MSLRNVIERFIAHQARLPKGVFGRVIMARIFSAANRHRHQITLQQLSLSKKHAVLDVGCGNGDFLFNLRQHSPSCFAVGIELSSAMSTIVQRRNTNHRAGRSVDIARADWNRLPFLEDSFDRVIASNIIYFWEKPHESLSEIHRVLKASGKLTIIFQPIPPTNQAKYLSYGYVTYSQETVIQMLNDNGFRIIDVLSKEENSKNRSWEVLWITASRGA